MRRVGRVLLRLSESRHVPVAPNDARNLAHIEETRQRKGRQDWEDKLESPVDRVLPFSRGQVGEAVERLGAGR